MARIERVSYGSAFVEQLGEAGAITIEATDLPEDVLTDPLWRSERGRFHSADHGHQPAGLPSVTTEVSLPRHSRIRLRTFPKRRGADMTRLYGEPHRALQDQFETRKMADRLEQIICKTEFDEESQGFIEALDMFFLATVDYQGRPTVSYKGGDPGFVKIIDSTTLVFPSYDGNGMFLSMGNVAQNRQVGMLFISFERPHRLRVQGTASISRDDPMMSRYKEADFVVRVKLSALWQNCPRYIHRYQKVNPSRYVPRAACATPLAEWKRIDLVHDVLPTRDAAQVEAAGTIGVEEWMDKVKSGDPTA